MMFSSSFAPKKVLQTLARSSPSNQGRRNLIILQQACNNNNILAGVSSSTLSTFTTSSMTTTTTTTGARRYIHIEKRLEELGITLPKPSAPRANYNIVCHASGNMLYVSGHLPFKSDGTLMTGRIGEDGRGKDYGYEAARNAGLNIVSTLQAQLGDLDRVEKIVKIFGIVQSTNDFKEQHLVMDGCSDVLMEIFGKEVGYHARSAIGTSTLPIDISVEVEAVVQIKPE